MAYVSAPAHIFKSVSRAFSVCSGTHHHSEIHEGSLTDAARGGKPSQGSRTSCPRTLRAKWCCCLRSTARKKRIVAKHLRDLPRAVVHIIECVLGF